MCVCVCVCVCASFRRMNGHHLKTLHLAADSVSALTGGKEGGFMTPFSSGEARTGSTPGEADPKLCPDWLQVSCQIWEKRKSRIEQATLLLSSLWKTRFYIKKMQRVSYPQVASPGEETHLPTKEKQDFLEWKMYFWNDSKYLIFVSSSPPPHFSILTIELLHLHAIVILAFSLLPSSILVIYVSAVFYFCLSKWMEVCKGVWCYTKLHKIKTLCKFFSINILFFWSHYNGTKGWANSFHCNEISLYWILVPQWDLTNINTDKNKLLRGFPGGAAVENPPANAGDTGSSPGPGRSHMPRSN